MRQTPKVAPAPQPEVPELPEVESARAVIDRHALGRRIVDVDDSDSYECRPHLPGEIRAALLGRRLLVVHRRGKSMWCETSGAGRSRTPGPMLGIHLGMSGKIVISDGDGSEDDGGDYWRRGRAPGDHRFKRFSLTFSDGGLLLLIDPRRLGRVRLDPPVDQLGPDARDITPAQLRAALASSSVALKARLMDQEVVAGIGNLLADEILWQARLSPARPAREVTRAESDRLLRATRSALTRAIRDGGVHTLKIIPYRNVGAHCPRCGTEMKRATIGGRTTWWCPKEQL